MPDPLTEEQVHIQLSWTADERTRRAIERQAKLMGLQHSDRTQVCDFGS